MDYANRNQHLCILQKEKESAAVENSFIPQITDDSTDATSQVYYLHHRLQKLDYLDRAIVLLWLEDMAYDEIGAIVGMDAKNIGVRLVRIKNKLKNIKDDE